MTQSLSVRTHPGYSSHIPITDRTFNNTQYILQSAIAGQGSAPKCARQYIPKENKKIHRFIQSNNSGDWSRDLSIIPSCLTPSTTRFPRRVMLDLQGNEGRHYTCMGLADYNPSVEIQRKGREGDRGVQNHSSIDRRIRIERHLLPTFVTRTF